MHDHLLHGDLLHTDIAEDFESVTVLSVTFSASSKIAKISMKRDFHISELYIFYYCADIRYNHETNCYIVLFI